MKSNESLASPKTVTRDKAEGEREQTSGGEASPAAAAVYAPDPNEKVTGGEVTPAPAAVVAPDPKEKVRGGESTAI